MFPFSFKKFLSGLFCSAYFSLWYKWLMMYSIHLIWFSCSVFVPWLVKLVTFLKGAKEHTFVVFL